MKKIVIAFDSVRFSDAALNFAIKLNEKSPILLTGAFLPQSIIASAWSYADSVQAGMFIPLMEVENADEVKTNIDHFKTVCEHNNIEYRVHKDFFDFAIDELRRESRFADLVIIGSNAFYQNVFDKVPNVYIKQVLHDVECPVLIVPDKSEFPTSNILSYDGSADSVFAIKQFAYLFDELTANTTSLVYFNNEDNDDLPEKINIEELAARHFPDLDIMKLTFDPKKYLNSWLENKRSSILVTGAYGRTALSRLFKQSFINGVITDQQVPLFIAHRNS